MLRWKLRRFRKLPGLQIPERHLAQRCLDNLVRLAKLVLPRVWTAVFSTVCSRWCTARRFQDLTEDTRCRFGCASGYDSLEHYANCPHLASFAFYKLRLTEIYWKGICCWCLVSEARPSDKSLGKLAILVYCAYTAFDSLRKFNTRATGASDLAKLLGNLPAQAVERHTSRKFLEN